VVVGMGPVVDNLCHSRPRQETAPRPVVLRPDRLIVGIEENVVGFCETLVAGIESLEQEDFEKPRRVGEMLLGGANVEH